MATAPRVPAERVIQITAVSDRIIALTSEGKVWIANRSSFDWRPVQLPPLNMVAPMPAEE